MTIRLTKVALGAGLLCMPLLPTALHAEVTPDQFNLLMVASKKDGGKDFATLVELLIAANPDDEAEIREVAAQIMPAPPVEPEPEPEPAPPPAIVDEDSIFSDSTAQRFSNAFLPGWEKEVELTGVFTTGNTDQKSFGAATKFFRDSEPFQQTITGYFDINTSDGVTNKRRYGVALKNDYSVSDISYISGFASYESDSFGAFNKRFTLNAGYGVRVFDNDSYKWSVEAGPAMLITKPAAIEDYETDITAYASSLFSWNINERSDFENETKVFVGNKVVIENKSDYTLQISGALSSKLSFDVIYNRDAPIDRKKTDTITRIGILYDF